MIKESFSPFRFSRRAVVSRLALLPALSGALTQNLAEVATASETPLVSWKDGPAKKAILDFVRATTDQGSPNFVAIEERIATFDQDGTLWVEQPIYSQIVYCLHRVVIVAKQNPKLKEIEPFRTVLSGDREAIARLPVHELLKIVAATLTGMDVESFQEQAAAWIGQARDFRWKRLFTELVYQPQIELLAFLRANGFKTYIVTGGGQDFVRNYSQRVYGIPVEHVVGTMGGVSYTYDARGEPELIKEPKLLLNDDNAGKPEGIHLMIGRRPRFTFGNSNGDREMCEYTTSGNGARLAMLVLHDDAEREYAYGPAQGLPESRIGTFSQALHDEAKEKGWTVVSMKNDWSRIFTFEP